MDEIKKSIFKNLNLTAETEFAKAWSTYPAITVGQVIDAVIQHNTGPDAIKSLGRGARTFNEGMKKLFPEVYLAGRAQTWRWWLLKNSDYKKCTKCSAFKLKTEFNKDAGNADNLAGYCRDCAKIRSATHYKSNPEYYKNYLAEHQPEQKARTAKRRSAILERTPKWSQPDEILEFYRNCPEGYHVDHYYPLQGETVCGLHVLENLQYLTAKENLSKGNKMPEDKILSNPLVLGNTKKTYKRNKTLYDTASIEEIESKILSGKTWLEVASEYNGTATGLRDYYERISGKKCGSFVEKKTIEISAEEIEYWVTNFSWTRASKELGLSDNGLRKRYTKLTGNSPKSLKSQRGRGEAG